MHAVRFGFPFIQPAKLQFVVLARQRPWLSLWESCQPNRLTERVLRLMIGKRPLERGTLSDCPLRGSQLSQRESQGRFAPRKRYRAVCTNQGSLWEGAVSQRLTEGESPGFFDAVSYEALAVDQRSLPQSASRPAPSQREPLVHTAKLQFIYM